MKNKNASIKEDLSLMHALLQRWKNNSLMIKNQYFV